MAGKCWPCKHQTFAPSQNKLAQEEIEMCTNNYKQKLSVDILLLFLAWIVEPLSVKFENFQSESQVKQNFHKPKLKITSQNH
jgi:hypothetical protein